MTGDAPRPPRTRLTRGGTTSGRAGDLPIWRQALTGIGLVTLGALAAVGVGLAMAAVLSWLF